MYYDNLFLSFMSYHTLEYSVGKTMLELIGHVKERVLVRM